MAEYIKREDAKKAILEACGCDYRCMVGCNGMCDIHAGSVWGAVDNIPAADVRENVSARWIGMDSDSERYDDICCSNCRRIYTVDAYHWCDIGFIKDDLKYCPNCGAEMREVQDG